MSTKTTTSTGARMPRSSAAATLAQPGEEIVALVVRPPEGDAPSMSDDLAPRALASGYSVIDIDPGTAPDMA